MDSNFEARVIVALSQSFAQAVNDNGINYTDRPELTDLKDILKQEKATLTNVMRDFEYYVQSSDAHGAEASPLINWSRDATTNDRATKYYASKFVITFNSGTKVVPMEVAKRVEEKLKPLEGQGVVEQVRVDSMDPAQNPAIPKRYFP